MRRLLRAVALVAAVWIGIAGVAAAVLAAAVFLGPAGVVGISMAGLFVLCVMAAMQ